MGREPWTRPPTAHKYFKMHFNHLLQVYSIITKVGENWLKEILLPSILEDLKYLCCLVMGLKPPADWDFFCIELRVLSGSVWVLSGCSG